MNDKLPRELMESCLAAAQEATFAGFDDSVLKEVFASKRRRLFETLYRMGFESGWRIREQQIAARVGAEGWKRLAESLKALGETDDRIRELDERYGLGAAAVSQEKP